MSYPNPYDFDSDEDYYDACEAADAPEDEDLLDTQAADRAFEKWCDR